LSFVDVGSFFVDSLDVPKKMKDVKAIQLRTAQQAAKATFKQVSSAFVAVRRSREALAKATAQRRKVANKASAAVCALKQAEHKSIHAECEWSCVSSQEEGRRLEQDELECKVSECETTKAAAEVKELQLKQRREKLKEAIPLARETAKFARAAEKEAIAERQAVQAQFSKVERAQSKMEDLITSATESLKAEEYDANQVQMAYVGVKKKVGNLPDCKEAASAAAKSYEDACNIARSSEERLSETFKASERQLVIVSEDGKATGDGIVDAPVESLRCLRTAVDTLKTSLDTMAIRQAELECADDDLNETYSRLTECGVSVAVARQRNSVSSGGSPEKNRRAAERTYKSWEKQIKVVEQGQAKAQQLAEAAWEEMSQLVQKTLEAGNAFADSFVPSEEKSPPMSQVRSAQHSTRASFRQVSSVAIAVRKAREGWVKAAAQRRKTVQKESAALLANAEAGSVMN